MKINMRNSLNSLGFLSLLFFSAGAEAASSDWVSADFIKVRLVTEDASATSTKMRGALEIVLEPEWHIYWRMPGDGGLPPELDWNESKNFKGAKLEWPAPVRFEYEGLYGFGYKNHALLPLTIETEKAGVASDIVLQADIMVCRELCIPQSLDLKMSIPAGATAVEELALIDQAWKALPFKEDRPDIKIESVVMGPKAIVVQAYLAQGFDQADLFVEAGSDLYIVTKPEINVDTKDPRKASMIIAAPEGTDNLAKAIMGRTLTLTLVKGDKALEKEFSF